MDMSFLNSLVVYSPKGKKIRYGTKGDGGYVLVDGHEYDFFIGCGVGLDISFETEFFTNHPNTFGLLFDGTISKEYVQAPSQMSFIQKNISPTNTQQSTNLIDEIQSYENVFLKMDIEWHEWNWIRVFPHFNKIKQMVIEFHGFLEEENDLIPRRKNKLLEKINKTHFLVHVHPNSCDTRRNDEISNVMELTYVRKNDFLVEGVNRTPFPISNLDYPNCGEVEIINLDFPPFSF
jgi:hypothetical protein